MINVLRAAAKLGLLALLTACSSAFQATGDTLLYSIDPDRRVNAKNLNPDFTYLRVIVDGRLAFLAHGAVDRVEGRDLDVYFSGTGEVLKLSSGRIEEFSSDQRHISIRPLAAGYPGWDVLALNEYRVEVNSRPGYRFSAPQRRLLRPLERPPRKTNLMGIDPRSLQWFEEVSDNTAKSQTRSLFGILVELSGPKVVYSEQCIDSDICLSLQRWRASGSY